MKAPFAGLFRAYRRVRRQFLPAPGLRASNTTADECPREPQVGRRLPTAAGLPVSRRLVPAMREGVI